MLGKVPKSEIILYFFGILDTGYVHKAIAATEFTMGTKMAKDSEIGPIPSCRCWDFSHAPLSPGEVSVLK